VVILLPGVAIEMAPAGFSGRRRQFDVACGVLSRCVKKAEAATAGKTMAAAPAAAAAAAPTTAPPTTMPLMPGADVTPDVREEEPSEATTQLAPLTIMYGHRVVVFDDFPSYRVAELLVLVAERERPDLPGAGGTTTDIPVARKASLQRFMEKRRDRLVARAPYAARPAPASSNEERRNLQAGEQDAGSSWLGLGVPGGGCAC
jgi:jasmonate ZIM domain-containing protein